MAASDLSGKAQAALGLPAGMKTFSPFPFAGMDTQASSIAMKDQDFRWMENYIRTGDGSLRTAWDKGPSLYTAPLTTIIVYYSFYTIGSTYYVAIFFSDGTAVQVDVVTRTSILIGSRFYGGSGLLPCARQWGTQYLLICNRNTPNDYWVWDGALLYTAGTSAPNGVNILAGGANYSSDPTITTYGGTGTGMTFTTKESSGQIAQIQIANPGTGYEVGDVVQLAFTGGGSDTSPILTAELTATGVGGATVTRPGVDYTFASVTLTGGGGTGATATANISNGISAVTITAPGAGYTTATVNFSGGGGTGAAATATILNGQISYITVTVPGSNYTSAPTVTIAGNGAGAFATATISNGVIGSITITNPGSGYTSAPLVSIIGDGDGATGIALLMPVGVNDVVVVNGGTGFTTVPLITFVGGGGAGAVGIVKLTGTSVDKINLTAGGSGYTSAPTVNFIGGDGTGATATANLVGDTVGSVTITAPGSGYTSPISVTFTGGGGSGAGGTVLYVATSIASVVISSTGTNYTTAPAVEVTPGANNSAYATVNLMPFGVSGSAIETFLSRVWIINPAPDPFSTVPPGGNFSFSAPGSVIDFSTSGGGGNATNTDSFLQTQYVNVRQSSGYLYFFGDGSISVISNVATSGTPSVTTYNYQNVDPQAGLEWRDALQDFGRSTIIVNSTGVYGLYGGAATKISGKINDLFQNALFPPDTGSLTPSSAVAVLFDNRHYLNLMTIQEPDTGIVRNVMVTWNEKDWYITTQTVDLTFIATQKIGSNYTAWGTDGRDLYPLFQQPSTALNKRLDTKQYGTDKMFIQKQLLATWLQVQDQSASGDGVDGTLTMISSGLVEQVHNFESVPSVETNLIIQQPHIPSSPPPFWGVWATGTNGQTFMALSLRFESKSADFILGNWVLGYLDIKAFF